MPPASPTPPPVPASSIPAPGRVEAPHREALWWKLVLVVIIALGVLWFWVFKAASPSTLPHLEFLGAGAPAWYTLSGKTLTSATGPGGFDKAPFAVVDSGPTFADGDTPVLVQVKTGVAIGVVKKDGTLTMLLDDGTQKEGLAVRTDGLAAYSVPSSAEGTQELMLFDFLNPSAPRDVGPGRDPRVAGDGSGSFLGLAPQGLVRIDSVTHQRNIVVTHPTGDAPGGAISPDGTMVAFAYTAAKQIDFFSIQLTRPAYSNFLGSLSGIPDGGGAFLNNTQFAARSGAGVAIYSVPDGTRTTASLVQSFTIAPQ